MAPHDAVDVDERARKTRLHADRLDNPRSRAAVHLVDENHVPTLRRDVLILNPHTTSPRIELHLQPEAANTDKVSLRPRPPVRQACGRSAAKLRGGVAGCEPSGGSAPEYCHTQSGGAVGFAVPDGGDGDRCGYAESAARDGSAGLRTSRCTATEGGCNNQEDPHCPVHGRSTERFEEGETASHV